MTKYNKTEYSMSGVSINNRNINNEKILLEIAEEILKRIPKNKEEVSKIKKEISKKYKLNKIPSDADVLKAFEKFNKNNITEYKILRRILKKKPVRTISGVAVVSVMTSPAKCPHGKCIPCPGGIEFNTPQSYIGLEPAAQRGKQHNYNPYSQVKSRIKELRELGHSVDKVEIIVMGGTFPARDRVYRDYFIANIYKALNDFLCQKCFEECFEEYQLNEFFDEEKSKKIIEQEKIRNENAKARCVGLTIETRPDYAGKREIPEMLKYGATKVEIGVQSVYNDVLIKINRGHSIDDVIYSTQLLKDSAFKVGYHIMPGLPSKGKNKDFKRDLKMFKILFSDENFKPDYLKIYPTLVIKGTTLYEWWKNGEYEPYTTDEVVELIAIAKKYIPEYVRIQRIQRDIPVGKAIGIDKGNIRQLVKLKTKELGISCKCIRCREFGHKILEFRNKISSKEYKNLIKESELVIRKYKSSKGVDYFISYEIKSIDALIGFIRLRFPFNPFIKCLKDCALIRELHIYGEAIPIGEKAENFAVQHTGFGEKLLCTAEEIAKEKYDKIAIISGVGVREYYRKLGYSREYEYMIKYI